MRLKWFSCFLSLIRYRLLIILVFVKIKKLIILGMLLISRSMIQSFLYNFFFYYKHYSFFEVYLWYQLTKTKKNKKIKSWCAHLSAPMFLIYLTVFGCFVFFSDYSELLAETCSPHILIFGWLVQRLNLYFVCA